MSTSFSFLKTASEYLSTPIFAMNTFLALRICPSTGAGVTSLAVCATHVESAENEKTAPITPILRILNMASCWEYLEPRPTDGACYSACTTGQSIGLQTDLNVVGARVLKFCEDFAIFPVLHSA
jgi:hypothetical protein